MCDSVSNDTPSLIHYARLTNRVTGDISFLGFFRSSNAEPENRFSFVSNRTSGNSVPWTLLTWMGGDTSSHPGILNESGYFTYIVSIHLETSILQTERTHRGGKSPWTLPCQTLPRTQGLTDTRLRGTWPLHYPRSLFEETSNPRFYKPHKQWRIIGLKRTDYVRGFLLRKIRSECIEKKDPSPSYYFTGFGSENMLSGPKLRTDRWNVRWNVES